MTEQKLIGADAINQAFKEEMRRDKRVVMWGEDLVSMGGGRTTQGIYEEFGDRILDTPIVEDAIVGMAVGAAYAGLRPIGVLMSAGFLPIACDQVFLKLGATYQEWGYQGPMPVVIFTTVDAGGGAGLDHTLSPEALLIHSPGLKVVMPATAYDAKGLLKSAIRDDHPIVFISHRRILYGEGESIPTEEYLIPLGKADVKREGKDITIVAYSVMVSKALSAAEELGKEGIDVEVVDLRCLVPLDVDAIVTSVEKTQRLLITHEAMKRGGPAAEIAFRVNEAAPDIVRALKAPIRRVAAPNIALPHGVEIERQILPQVEDIVTAVKEMVV